MASWIGRTASTPYHEAVFLPWTRPGRTHVWVDGLCDRAVWPSPSGGLVLEGAAIGRGRDAEGVTEAGAHVGAAAEAAPDGDLFHLEVGGLQEFSRAVDAGGQEPLVGADAGFLAP